MEREYDMAVRGMTCDRCIQAVERCVLEDPSVRRAVASLRGVRFTASRQPDFDDMAKRMAALGYSAQLESAIDLTELRARDNPPKVSPVPGAAALKAKRLRLRELLPIAAGFILLLYAMFRLFGYNVFNVIPTIDSSLTYGMLFMTGLLTSVHCVSMCGAIGLSASFSEGPRNLARPLLYNLGRMISYACAGAIVGALGSVLGIGRTAQGAIILVAALAMIAMSLRMMGYVNFPRLRLPVGLASMTRRFGGNALVLGLLNGLMPCGPLQSMQIYALSTGSAIAGALSLLSFGLGTLPLMLTMGLAVQVAGGAWRARMNKAAAVMVMLLGVVMLNRALLIGGGIDLSRATEALFGRDYAGCAVAQVHDGYQQVDLNLDYNGYGDFVVEQDTPVRLVIHADQTKMTNCNSALSIPEYNIEVGLQPGSNVLEFTPAQAGDFTYTCWMGMISNSIHVVPHLK